MQKWILPSGIALVVTFFLFSFMAFLIKRPPMIEQPNDPIPAYTPVTERTSELIIKPTQTIPPKPSVTEPIRTIAVINDTPDDSSSKVAFDPLSMEGMEGSLLTGGTLDTTMGKPSGNDSPDTNASPIVQIQPQYPIDAARRGIEGWVKLSFSIDKTGSVSRIEVLDASPARVFDRQAVRALKRWRYKAKFVNGAPVVQDNLQIQLDFNLDKP